MKLFLLLLFFLSVGIINAQNSPTLAQATTFLAQQKTAFEENKGQVWDTEGKMAPEVKYHFKQKGIDIFILPKGMAYQFTKVHYPKGYEVNLKKVLSPKEQKIQKALRAQIRTETYRMNMELVGANPNAKIIAEGKSKDYVQYYNRNALDVRSFKKLTYQAIYPGIDWVIYTTKTGLKYDFIVQPGADPNQIQLKFKHYEDLKINADGSFTLSNSMGSITEQAPVSFQEGQDIQTTFKLDGDLISFDLSSYDNTKLLTIDPNLIWASYYGGISQDYAFNCVTDSSDAVYFVGQTQSVTNIASGGHQNSFSGGDEDAFIAKFDSLGTRLWASYYGGTHYEFGFGCAIDKGNNVYLTGMTTSITNIAFGGHQDTISTTASMNEEAFIVKFNSAGTRLWASYYGGFNQEDSRGCVVDRDNNVYLCGTTNSNSKIASGGHQDSLGGDHDAFIVKFDSAGTRLWASYYGDTGNDYGSACAIDSINNVYLVGSTASTANIASGGHQNNIGGSGNDAFIVKFDSAGTRLWASYYGGMDMETGYACIIDGSNNVYLSGRTASTTNIAFGGHQDSLRGVQDAFIVKFNSSGTRLWASYYGGMDIEIAYACATDQADNVYLTGITTSIADIAFGGYQNNHGGYSDAFIVKFNSTGTRLWASYYGGNLSDYTNDCTLDGKGNLYLVGFTDSPSDIAQGGHQNIYHYSYDAFIAKLTNTYCTTVFVIDTQTACNSYTWMDGNTYTISNNSATDTLTAANGCDSIVTLNLTINNSNTGTDIQTACDSYTWIDGNTYTTNNNSATFTLTNINGCDSVITLDLTINTIDTTTSIAGTSITANATGATYQWVDCATGFSPINNETGQSFTPSQNGDYAVVITQNSCVDTSSCHTIIVVGINDLMTNNDITIYPNPTTKNIHIDFGKVEHEFSIKTYSSDGKLIQSKTSIQGTSYQLELPKTAGLYLLEIKTNQGLSYYKVIKE